MWIKLRSTTLVPIFVVINYQSSLICIIMVSKCSLKVEKDIWKICFWNGNNGVCFVLNFVARRSSQRRTPISPRPRQTFFSHLNQTTITMRSAVVPIRPIFGLIKKRRQKLRQKRRQSQNFVAHCSSLVATTNARQPSPSPNVLQSPQSGQTF